MVAIELSLDVASEEISAPLFLHFASTAVHQSDFRGLFVLYYLVVVVVTCVLLCAASAQTQRD